MKHTGQAANDVHRNLHQGKVGVLAPAPEEGLGVRDHELRARHLDAINLFRAAPAGVGPMTPADPSSENHEPTGAGRPREVK